MRLLHMAAVILWLPFSALNSSSQSNPEQPAPAPQSSEPTESASIYITVATKKGLVVRDLTPEDLTITENNVPAKIDKVSCGKPEPLLVGILVDVSGSRRSDPHLRLHYDALVGFLNEFLSGDDGVYVVAFNDKIYKLSDVTADRAAISAGFDKLRNQQPYGSTALYDAIKATAGANFKGRSGRRVLIVVGDWEDNSSHVGSDEALEAAQRNSATIYGIVDTDGGLESKKSHKRAVEVFTKVTKEAGGLAYDVEEKGDFAKALQAIGRAVTGSCRLEYVTSKSPDTKKGVALRVQASSKDILILYPRVRFERVAAP